MDEKNVSSIGNLFPIINESENILLNNEKEINEGNELFNKKEFKNNDENIVINDNNTKINIIDNYNNNNLMSLDLEEKKEIISNEKKNIKTNHISDKMEVDDLERNIDINHNNDINKENKMDQIDNSETKINIETAEVDKNDNISFINPQKIKEIEDIKSRINHFKKLLKPKNINKIKENFIEKTYTYNETINHLNTNAIIDSIYNPQKMMNICDELLTRYKFYIPNFLSRGPQIVPSKINNDLQQLSNRYRMIYNNLNRIPNVQKYLSLHKIISFPDKKLVEYDSGKLIKLANLLKKLKQNKSKALIFTQVIL
jgi:hypothetical protein